MYARVFPLCLTSETSELTCGVFFLSFLKPNSEEGRFLRAKFHLAAKEYPEALLDLDVVLAAEMADADADHPPNLKMLLLRYRVSLLS